MKDVIKRLQERYHYALVVFKELVKTNFKLRYQGSYLGVLWSVLQPLMLFAVMYIVFVRFLKFTDGTPTFAISLLCGTCLWSFFNESTSMGIVRIVDRGDLLRKIHFPELHHRRRHHDGRDDFPGHQPAGRHRVRLLRECALHVACASWSR